MKRTGTLQNGFTLSEVMMATAIVGTAFALICSTTVSLQKSFRAVDAYFSSHMQQMRIVNYIARDTRRAYIVTTSANLQTVTMTIPDYIDPATGLPRTPEIFSTATGKQVRYGPTNPATGNYPTSTVVYAVEGASITRRERPTANPPPGPITTIASSADQLVPLTSDTEVLLTNTEYTKTAVTFKPIFTSNGGTMSATGTTVLSLTYLRNLRRG